MAAWKCAVVLTTLAAGAAAQEVKSCFLLGGDKADKPFPSLTQCYKQNQQACCVSAHDHSIANDYGTILSGTCIREYSHLEQYFCLGCSPDADDFIDYYNATTIPSDLGGGKYREYITHDQESANSGSWTVGGNDGNAPEATKPKISNMYKKVKGKYGTIKLCSSFADKLLYQDGAATMTVDAYDGCGLLLGGTAMGQGYDGSGILSRTFFALGDANRVGGTSSGAITSIAQAATSLPGYGNAAASSNPNTNVKISPEWLFFQTLRPTYFGVDEFEISWNNEAGTGADGMPTCFGAGNNLQVGFIAVALVAVLAQRLA